MQYGNLPSSICWPIFGGLSTHLGLCERRVWCCVFPSTCCGARRLFGEYVRRASNDSLWQVGVGGDRLAMLALQLHMFSGQHGGGCPSARWRMEALCQVSYCSVSAEGSCALQVRLVDSDGGIKEVLRPGYCFNEQVSKQIVVSSRAHHGIDLVVLC
eukprot:2609244-Amphidinium_carterae.1